MAEPRGSEIIYLIKSIGRFSTNGKTSWQATVGEMHPKARFVWAKFSLRPDLRRLNLAQGPICVGQM